VTASLGWFIRRDRMDFVYPSESRGLSPGQHLAHDSEFTYELASLAWASVDTVTSPSLGVFHADPLSPLRERDLTALGELFALEAALMEQVVLDVHRYLARLYPEPCWEDEPYEFLRGYV
jgi:hypothetical protein